MGVTVSKDEKSQLQISKQIDCQISSDKAADARIIKLLLLGAGECGKSTVLKQMKILHCGGFSTEEAEHQRIVILQNVLQSISVLVAEMNNLNIKYDDPVREVDIATVQTIQDFDELCTSSKYYGEVIFRIWNDPGIQACFERRSEFQLNDSAKYFLDSLDRIMDRDYIPTQDDILNARARTLGIVKVSFAINSTQFRVVDVGGQRSQRRKWIHCFDNVHSLMFIAAVSEYDQVLREDYVTNRIKESVQLLKSTLNSPFFTKATLLLFLNKKDLLEEKLSRSPLSKVFPKYRGGNDIEAALEFFKNMFTALNQDKEKQIFVHSTCATDTGQMSFILSSSMKTIKSKCLRGSGFD